MQILIFCGLPGAGKSTFYASRFLHTHVRLNLDMLKTRHREQILFEACLRAKQPVVIDNTNPDPQSRARYLLPALAAHFRAEAYWFCASVDEASARNDLRSGRALVPRAGMLSVAKKMQRPRYDEGFTTIFRVETLSDGAFACHEMEKDAI